MSITEVRNRFHALIDEVENPLLLKKFYDIMRENSKAPVKKLWDGMSVAEKEELIAAYEESKDEKNLISNKAVMDKHMAKEVKLI
jgi:hypothetical protein